MKKLLVLLMSFSLVLVLSSNVYAVNEWQEGTGENSILGTISPSDLDKDSFENVVDPLDRLLSDYRKGVKISYASASSLSVSAGQVTCDNSERTIRKFRENTSATTVSFSDLDTGAEANDTYYVYAVADTSVTTFTIKISLSSTAPSGVTSFLKLGQFYNNSSSNIEQVKNDDTKPEILISTGTVTHGGTIPLPSGYIESQCEWIVSANNASHDGYGQYESDDSGIQCYTTGRVLYISVYALNAWHTGGTANYMIIGIQR